MTLIIEHSDKRFLSNSPSIPYSAAALVLLSVDGDDHRAEDEQSIAPTITSAPFFNLEANVSLGDGEAALMLDFSVFSPSREEAIKEARLNLKAIQELHGVISKFAFHYAEALVELQEG